MCEVVPQVAGAVIPGSQFGKDKTGAPPATGTTSTTAANSGTPAPKTQPAAQAPGTASKPKAADGTPRTASGVVAVSPNKPFSDRVGAGSGSGSTTARSITSLLPTSDDLRRIILGG